MRNRGIDIAGGNIRGEIRRSLVKDNAAFDACRDIMVIQTVHRGREYFWDGFGNPKPVQWFHEAEIIIDFQPTNNTLANRLFELVKQEN